MGDSNQREGHILSLKWVNYSCAQQHSAQREVNPVSEEKVSSLRRTFRACVLIGWGPTRLKASEVEVESGWCHCLALMETLLLKHSRSPSQLSSLCLQRSINNDDLLMSQKFQSDTLSLPRSSHSLSLSLLGVWVMTGSKAQHRIPNECWYEY